MFQGLRWPEWWPRATRRRNTSLGIDRGRAQQTIMSMLANMGADGIEITCEAPTRGTDGVLRQPTDSGVAVWFTSQNYQYAVACDEYVFVRDNLAALSYLFSNIYQLTSIGMHHAASVMLGALREPESEPYEPDYGPDEDISGTDANWWTVFGFQTRMMATLEKCEKKYRDAVKRNHPDRPDGDEEAMKIYTQAITLARKHFDK